MGTIIKASSICANGTHSAIELSAQAGEKCIEKAGIDRNDVDLLIYAGVYRDDNIAEPAIAPLIQKKLGMNTDPLKGGESGKMTFSFDINNGECGFLSAVTVAEAALKSGSSRYTLIISGDAHPSKKKQPDFPYSNVGSAVLLAYTEEKEKGFTSFMFRTADNEDPGLTSYLVFDDIGKRGREMASIVMDDDYHSKLHSFAVESIQKYIESIKLDPLMVRYLVTSQQYKGFGSGITHAIGLNGTPKVIDLHDEYGDSHTSSLPLSFHHIANNGGLKEHDRILFVAAGSGLSSACAMYVV
jgi:3-oxoacyl-[acyl-carrier-protein] synthase III